MKLQVLGPGTCCIVCYLTNLTGYLSVVFPQVADEFVPAEAQPLPQALQGSSNPWAIFPGMVMLYSYGNWKSFFSSL